MQLQLTILDDDECGYAFNRAKGSEEACFGGPGFDAEEDSFLNEKRGYLQASASLI